jgi:hypothetical protein
MQKFENNTPKAKGAGFWWTGTLPIKASLEELGFGSLRIGDLGR